MLSPGFTVYADSTLTKTNKTSPQLLKLPAHVWSVGRCEAAPALLQVKQEGQTCAEKKNVGITHYV